MESWKEELVEAFHNSLERCGSSRKFLGRFYEIFLASSPAVAARFADTNFATQTRALQTSFYMAMLASSRRGEAADYLNRIAGYHSHSQMDIKPEYYDLWIDSLVAAVREFDPKFDDGVERVWREFLQPAIEYMKAKY